MFLEPSNEKIWLLHESSDKLLWCYSVESTNDRFLEDAVSTTLQFSNLSCFLQNKIALSGIFERDWWPYTFRSLVSYGSSNQGRVVGLFRLLWLSAFGKAILENEDSKYKMGDAERFLTKAWNSTALLLCYVQAGICRVFQIWKTKLVAKNLAIYNSTTEPLTFKQRAWTINSISCQRIDWLVTFFAINKNRCLNEIDGAYWICF